MNESELREQIAAFGALLFRQGLSFGSSGNISVSVDDGWLMTPTGSSLGDLDPARISRLDLEGRHIDGDTRRRKPSCIRVFTARARKPGPSCTCTRPTRCR